MEELHNWLFHYNPYQKHWVAFKREESSSYFNGELKNTLSSTDFKTLVEILSKTSGDEKKIKKLLKDG
jgi:hypothetical protein